MGPLSEQQQSASINMQKPRQLDVRQYCQNSLLNIAGLLTIKNETSGLEAVASVLITGKKGVHETERWSLRVDDLVVFGEKILDESRTG